MQFSSKMCQAILDGKKTQTRRLVKEGEWAVNQRGRPIPDPVWGASVDAVYSAKGRMKWQVGRTYTIQPGRGKKAVGWFLLLAIRREQLQDITGQDAMDEGFQPIQHTAPSIVLIPDPKIVDAIAIEMFAEYWDSLHRPKDRWHKNPEVWVLEIGKVTIGAEPNGNDS